MRPPIYVRPLTDAERHALAAGQRSADAFVLRRCQILLASARGERAPRIAEALGCDDQTVLDALHAFNARGLDALQQGASRPHQPPPQAFPGERAEQLRALLHRSPREFGHPSSLWTLDLAAQVSCAQGLTPRVVSGEVSGEAIRTTLLRLGVGWKRAKHWITSPDPEYARKRAA
ncbi:MAG TPA: helix-turn-helix domain-containing protein [Ktedonobacterales bacterium]|nr:helix-turn-helix domain-containing protein [Ktedonobacterales bacterium]